MSIQDRNDDSNYKNKIANLSDLFFNNSINDETYMMDYTAGQVRKGNIYSTSSYWTRISDGNSVELKIAVNNEEIPTLFIVRSTGEATIDLIEGNTYTDNGTEIDIVNRNRASSNTPNSKIYKDPTIDTEGTTIAEEFIPGGARGASKIGGGADIREEFILQDNSEPLIRATNVSGSTADFFIKVIFVEK